MGSSATVRQVFRDIDTSLALLSAGCPFVPVALSLRSSGRTRHCPLSLLRFLRFCRGLAILLSRCPAKSGCHPRAQLRSRPSRDMPRLVEARVEPLSSPPNARHHHSSPFRMTRHGLQTAGCALLQGTMGSDRPGDPAIFAVTSSQSFSPRGSRLARANYKKLHTQPILVSPNSLLSVTRLSLTHHSTGLTHLSYL